MNPQQRNRVILLVLLGIVVAVVFWYQFLRSPATPGAPPAGPGAPTPAVTANPFIDVAFNYEELMSKIRDVDFRYADARQARDPMIALVGRAGSQFGPRGPQEPSDSTPERQRDEIIYEANRKVVTGIIWDERRPLAVISDVTDDYIVWEGFIFEGQGIMVEKIGPTFVQFRLDVEDEQFQTLIKELKEQ